MFERITARRIALLLAAAALAMTAAACGDDEDDASSSAESAAAEVSSAVDSAASQAESVASEASSDVESAMSEATSEAGEATADTSAGSAAAPTVTADLGSLSGKVAIDGSSTVEPITSAVAEEFSKQAGDVEVTVGTSGTGGGFEKFCNGETDISNASRPIEDDETTACADKGVEFIELEIAKDALTVAVNIDNDWATCLTTEQLKNIWDEGSTIAKWNEVNPDFPDEALMLYGPGTDSGTFDYFTAAINGEEGASPLRLHGVRGRQRARPGRRGRQGRPGLLRLRVLRGEPGHPEGPRGRQRRRLRRAQPRDGARRHLHAARRARCTSTSPRPRPRGRRSPRS